MDFRSTIKKLATTLKDANLSYMLIGGHAVMKYGFFRTTKDIDVAIQVDLEDIEQVIAILKSAGFKDRIPDAIKFAKRSYTWLAIDSASTIEIDVIMAMTGFEHEALTRTSTVFFDDVPVAFIGLEDLIIAKAIAGRPVDYSDIDALIQCNSQIDIKLILRYLREFDTEFSLNRSEKLKSALPNVFV